jgi:hypothetical protein
MAEQLLHSATNGMAITLTGNLHNRIVRGVDFDPDFWHRRLFKVSTRRSTSGHNHT